MYLFAFSPLEGNTKHQTKKKCFGTTAQHVWVPKNVEKKPVEKLSLAAKIILRIHQVSVRTGLVQCEIPYQTGSM
jgi:hypothetical protein